MKIYELLKEASAKPKFTAQIFFGHEHDLTNISKAPSKEAIIAFEKKAKEKFNLLKAAHPNKLKFATVPEAVAYMKDMDLDWPLSVWRIHGNHSKTKKATADWSGWEQPAELTPADIKVEEMDDGRILLSVKATSGPLIPIIRSAAYNAYFAKKKIQNALGKTINLSNFKSNKVIITATKKEVEGYLAKAVGDHTEFAERAAQRKADKEDPVKKKEANQQNYQLQKQRKQELYDKYGKDIIERVKIKSLTHIDGDDGYQWSLWVDGKRQWLGGMTYHEARHRQESMWRYLLRISKMSPEELKIEAELADGIRAYFLGQRLEVELNSYLHQMNKSAKSIVDASKKGRDAVRKAACKVDPAEEMERLIAKLRKKADDK